jgi:hypothetical protein
VISIIREAARVVLSALVPNAIRSRAIDFLSRRYCAIILVGAIKPPGYIQADVKAPGSDIVSEVNV